VILENLTCRMNFKCPYFDRIVRLKLESPERRRFAHVYFVVLLQLTYRVLRRT